jgi:hypothetical protein
MILIAYYARFITAAGQKALKNSCLGSVAHTCKKPVAQADEQRALVSSVRKHGSCARADGLG